MNPTRFLTLAAALFLTSLSLPAQNHPLDQYWSTQFGLPELPGGVNSATYLENGDVLAIADSLWRWDGSSWSIVSLPVGDLVVNDVSLSLPGLPSRSILFRDRIYSLATVVGSIEYNQIIWASAEGQEWLPYGDTLPPGQIVGLAIGPDGEGYVAYQRFNGGNYFSDIYEYDGVGWKAVRKDLSGIIPWIGVAPDGTLMYTLNESPAVSISWGEADTIATLRFPNPIGVPSAFTFDGDSAYGLVGFSTPGDFAISSFNRTTRTITVHDSLPSGIRFTPYGVDFARDGDGWVVTTSDGLIRGGEGAWESLGSDFIPARLATSPSGPILGYFGSSDSSILLNSIGIAEIDPAAPDPTWRGLYDTTRKYFGLDGTPAGVLPDGDRFYAYGEELRGAGPDGDAFGPILVNNWNGWQSIDGLFWTGNRRPVEVRQMIATEIGLWTIGEFDSIPSGKTAGLARWNGGWIGTDTTSLFDGPPLSMVVQGAGDVVVVLGTRSGDVDTTVIALWDGSAWTLIDETPGITGGRLAEIQDAALVVGGAFSNDHPLPDEGVAAIFPATGWRSLGGGLGFIEGRDPRNCGGRDTPRGLDLLEKDGLYVGGIFHRAGEVTSGGIARWNPEEEKWESPGYGLASTEGCIRVDAIGGLLRSVVAAGEFQQTDTTFPSTTDLGTGRIALYDTETDLWTPLGSGLSDPAGSSTLVVSDVQGYGTDIFVVGNFTSAGGQSSIGIARYLYPEPDLKAPFLPDTISFGTLSRVEEAEQDIIITNPLTSTRTVELRLMIPKAPFTLAFIHGTGSLYPATDTTLLRLAPGQSLTARIGIETEVSGTFSEVLRIESPQLTGYPRTIQLKAVRTTVGVEEEIRRVPLRLDLF